MTWIVGTVPPFGYSILVSDIRVSWTDGTERDCLQKVHKVGGTKTSVIVIDQPDKDDSAVPFRPKAISLFADAGGVPSVSVRRVGDLADAS